MGISADLLAFFNIGLFPTLRNGGKSITVWLIMADFCGSPDFNTTKTLAGAPDHRSELRGIGWPMSGHILNALYFAR